MTQTKEVVAGGSSDDKKPTESPEIKAFNERLKELYELGAVVVGAVGRAAARAEYEPKTAPPINNPVLGLPPRIAVMLSDDEACNRDYLSRPRPFRLVDNEILHIRGGSSYALIGQERDESWRMVDASVLGIRDRKLGGIAVRTLSIGAQLQLDRLSLQGMERDDWSHYSAGEFRAFATPLSRQSAASSEFLSGYEYSAFDAYLHNQRLAQHRLV